MKKATMRMLSWILSIAVAMSAMVFAIPASAEVYDSNAEFMAGKYGVFLHYLASKNSDGTVEGWNETVNSFAVNEFAKTVHAVGASWVTLTLTQSDGKYCIPMPELEELTGVSGLGTDRDLVNDLYTALSQYGIKLMLYWIPGAPSGSDETATAVAAALGATQRTGEAETADWVLNDATVSNMAQIMRAVSNRYGDKITGWWVDGCYSGETNFTAAYATQEAAALRAGNPDALVAFNAGTQYGDCRFPEESYTAGETCHYLRVDQDPFTNYSASGQYSENGYQRHFLTFLGSNWGMSNCIYNTDTLVQHCYDNILSKGAAITFDVGVSGNGTISPDQLNQISALDQYMHKSLELAVDFEDGYNPYMWTDNVTSDYQSTDSTEYCALVSGEEALNGNYSLKVTPPVTNTGRTDIVSGTGTAKQSIQFQGNPAFSKTDFSGCTGIMLRLKIAGDTSGVSHKIKLNVMQGNLPITRLTRGAFAFDSAGNKLNVSGGSENFELPAGFDGFVFFPLATAQSYQVTDPGRYDDYENYPQNLADFSQAFKMSIVLNDASWSGQTVLLDDIRFYTGTEQSALCDSLRALGYTSVVYKSQPAAYTFPIDFEDCQTPLTSVKFTGTKVENGNKSYPQMLSSTRLTNAGSEVLNGALSYVITNGAFPEDTDTVTYTPGNVISNYFAVEGVEALATEAITAMDYAYLKLRVRVSATENGLPYALRMGVRQNNKVYGYLGTGATGYDVNGNVVSEVQGFGYGGEGSALYIPSGFNGTIYIPFYGLRTSGWKNVFNPDNTDVAKPDLTQRFEMNFEFYDQNTSVLENSVITLDDIDVVYPYGGLPMTFEEPCDPRIVSLNNIYSGAEHKGDTSSVTLVSGNQALNGGTSVQFSIPTANNNSRTETDYVTILGNSDYTNDDLTSVTGIWLRMKVTEPEDYAGGQHTFAVTALQDSKISRRFRTYVALYDASGKRLQYNNGGNSPQGFKVPAGFDGFVFMPFVGQYSYNDWCGYLSDPTKFADYAEDWKLSLYFSDSTWNGSTVVIDDISYYSSYADWSDSGQLADMDADAWEAMRTAGYPITRNPQPASYSIPLDFEEGQIPFKSVLSWYSDGKGGYPTVTENQDITTAAEALNGNASFRVHVPVNSSYTAENGYRFIRAESGKAAFDGIAGISKASLADASANYAYLKLRIKLPATADGSAYSLFFGFQQEGNGYTTVLKGSYGYTVGGGYVALTTSDLYTKIPSGFDGTVYIPIKNQMCFLTTDTQVRGTSENMIDFGNSFSMYFSLYGSNWADTAMLLDDMEIEYNVSGDIDADGIADEQDLALLRRKLLNDSVSYADLYDINSDLVVDIRDLVRLQELMQG